MIDLWILTILAGIMVVAYFYQRANESVNKQFSLFGLEYQLRIVPAAFRRDVSKAYTLLLSNQWQKSEQLLDQMQRNYTSPGNDDIDVLEMRNQINDIKRELMV